jgi:hypothetical protein
MKLECRDGELKMGWTKPQHKGRTYGYGMAWVLLSGGKPEAAAVEHAENPIASPEGAHGLFEPFSADAETYVPLPASLPGERVTRERATTSKEDFDSCFVR